MNPLRIAPSLLSCDFARIAEELERVEAAGADWHHVDVMDGHFVPNLTIGPPVVAKIKEVSSIPLDVHLMISEPARYAQAFADAGADVVTFHREVSSDAAEVRATLKSFRDAGVREVGLALNPDLAVESVGDFLDEVDLILVMSVYAGFGGQKFIPDVLPKVQWLRTMGYTGRIEMDGGINGQTLESCVAAGADTLVAGSAIYGAEDMAETISRFRSVAERVRGSRGTDDSNENKPS